LWVIIQIKYAIQTGRLEEIPISPTQQDVNRETLEKCVEKAVEVHKVGTDE
jgi:hypothetical protein